MASKSEEIEFPSFAYRGVWWLPGKSRKKIAGTLTYNVEVGTRLDLIGGFEDALTFFQRQTALNYPIILGITEEGKHITLFDCNDFGEIHARLVFVDMHFRTEASIRFKNLSIVYLHLHEWAGMSRIKFEQPTSNSTVIRHDKPVSVQMTLARDNSMTLELETCTAFHVSAAKAGIEAYTDLNLQPTKPLSIHEYFDVLFEFQNFLSLATGHSVVPIAVRGQSEARKFKAHDQTLYPMINVYCNPVHAPRNPKRLTHHDMLFTLADVGDRLEAFVNNWFSKAETLRPVYDLYFGALRHTGLYSDTRFVFMIQALESYSRRTMPNKELPEEQHAAKIQSILDAVPVEHKTWLEGRLTYSNEPNLRKRLRNILDLFSEQSIAFLGKPKDFISRVVSVRNYLTHYDPGFGGRVPDGGEYHRMALQLRLLLEMCLLQEIGFADEEIRNLSARSLGSTRYGFLRQE